MSSGLERAADRLLLVAAAQGAGASTANAAVLAGDGERVADIARFVARLPELRAFPGALRDRANRLALAVGGYAVEAAAEDMASATALSAGLLRQLVELTGRPPEDLVRALLPDHEEGS